jgi:exodeoxyribonuclease VII large subunit
MTKDKIEPATRIYTVSELTSDIKHLLEETFPFVWVSGEISNFRIPASGHFYFTLKDEKAQIGGVMFRGQSRHLKFLPEDGSNITGLGRISLYEPRGAYQIIFEYLEPTGRGALQAAFEQLKERLLAEGLFDDSHKKPLPYLPRKISVVTSPTGAVIHDICNIIDRRFPNVVIEIIPVKVQGENAEQEIVNALELLNSRADADVAILARGGGSLEDLQAFNSEKVARAIFASEIPIVSAVGHEVDYTIADFVADLRAPTPSAAAEQVVPVKTDLKQRCEDLFNYLKRTFFQYIEHHNMLVDKTSAKLVHPRRKIEDLRLRTDDFTLRLVQVTQNQIRRSRERTKWRTERLNATPPTFLINRFRQRLDRNMNDLFHLITFCLSKNRGLYREIKARLNALSPMAVLDRGYSITRTIPDAHVVCDPDAVSLGQKLNVMVSKGSLICRVERKKKNVKSDDRTDI